MLAAPAIGGMLAPASVPMQLEHSNLQQLYKATPNIAMLPSLRREEYPHTRFWERVAWDKWVSTENEKGSFNTGVQGQGVNSSFMEDENGERVPIARQRQILDEAHSCWRTMRGFNINLMVFREMPATTMDYFRAWMESKCLELRLCANHWKADKVWGENFSSWNSNKSRRTTKPQNNGDEPPQPRSAEPSNGRRNL